ncbi:cobalamin biosynthesis protein [Chelativorans sp. YIM 93263]|uniref:cobalamin biosynthesis protein n=1 Tax=Chelativorans sp. YIM 93263 TaxID=2906648 RepID=UPI002377D4E1|nr:cobalamin biosynthesis protein [Chelativorans sp. YIM 93263]
MGESAEESPRETALPLQGKGAKRVRACHYGGRASNETGTENDISYERLEALATSEAKALEPAIIEAAKALGLPLIAVAQADLQRASDRCLTRSEASLAATGIASLSEAAALAAAGERSRLLGPRIAEGNVTCAIAQNRDET